MSKSQNPSTLWDAALEAFPYKDLESTSITQGDLNDAENTDIEYAEEFTFQVGSLLDDSLIAGGWIEYRQEAEEVTITAFFGIARNGDWEKGRILGEYEALQGSYNVETNTWDLSIDTY